MQFLAADTGKSSTTKTSRDSPDRPPSSIHSVEIPSRSSEPNPTHDPAPLRQEEHREPLHVPSLTSSPQGNQPTEPGFPQPDYPQQQGFPQPDYPRQQGFPQPGYPQQQGFPQPDYPRQQGFPQPDYPRQQGFPQPGFPRPGFPQPGYPQPDNPQPDNSQQLSLLQQLLSEGNRRNEHRAGNFIDDDFTYLESFRDKKVKRKFIRNVYIILSMQMMFTAGIVAAFILTESLRRFVQEHRLPLILGAIAAHLASNVVVITCKAIRTFPFNYILFATFATTLASLAAVISAGFDTRAVMIGVVLTASFCVAVTIIATVTTLTVTGDASSLCLLTLFLTEYGVAIVVLKMYCGVAYPTTVLGGLAALIFSIYMLGETHLIVGGYRYDLSPEEYVFGALVIYADVAILILAALFSFYRCSLDCSFLTMF